MSSNPSRPADAAKKKLRTELAAAQKQADAAKRKAKLNKITFRTAKQAYKDARRAAKKLRKSVKGLKAELAAMVSRRPRRKPAAPKTVKSPLPMTLPVVAAAPSGNPPTEINIPPVAPTT